MNLVYPALAQIAWTFVVLVMMARARVGSLSGRDVKMRDIALDPGAWPDRVRAIGNNFSNQFETPVLYFALSGIAVFVGATGWLITLLAWIYVASRVVHTLVHTGSNNVGRRFQVFAVGLAALLGMFLIILATLV
jgi:hypothetical protein